MSGSHVQGCGSALSSCLAARCPPAAVVQAPAPNTAGELVRPLFQHYFPSHTRRARAQRGAAFRHDASTGSLGQTPVVGHFRDHVSAARLGRQQLSGLEPRESSVSGLRPKVMLCAAAASTTNGLAIAGQPAGAILQATKQPCDPDEGRHVGASGDRSSAAGPVHTFEGIASRPIASADDGDSNHPNPADPDVDQGVRSEPPAEFIAKDGVKAISGSLPTVGPTTSAVGGRSRQQTAGGQAGPGSWRLAWWDQYEKEVESASAAAAAAAAASAAEPAAAAGSLLRPERPEPPNPGGPRSGGLPAGEGTRSGRARLAAAGTTATAGPANKRRRQGDVGSRLAPAGMVLARAPPFLQLDPEPPAQPPQEQQRHGDTVEKPVAASSSGAAVARAAETTVTTAVEGAEAEASTTSVAADTTGGTTSEAATGSDFAAGASQVDATTGIAVAAAGSAHIPADEARPSPDPAVPPGARPTASEWCNERTEGPDVLPPFIDPDQEEGRLSPDRITALRYIRELVVSCVCSSADVRLLVEALDWCLPLMDLRAVREAFRMIRTASLSVAFPRNAYMMPRPRFLSAFYFVARRLRGLLEVYSTEVMDWPYMLCVAGGMSAGRVRDRELMQLLHDRGLELLRRSEQARARWQAAQRKASAAAEEEAPGGATAELANETEARADADAESSAEGETEGGREVAANGACRAGDGSGRSAEAEDVAQGREDAGAVPRTDTPGAAAADTAWSAPPVAEAAEGAISPPWGRTGGEDDSVALKDTSGRSGTINPTNGCSSSGSINGDPNFVHDGGGNGPEPAAHRSAGSAAAAAAVDGQPPGAAATTGAVPGTGVCRVRGAARRGRRAYASPQAAAAAHVPTIGLRDLVCRFLLPLHHLGQPLDPEYLPLLEAMLERALAPPGTAAEPATAAPLPRPPPDAAGEQGKAGDADQLLQEEQERLRLREPEQEQLAWKPPPKLWLLRDMLELYSLAEAPPPPALLRSLREGCTAAAAELRGAAAAAAAAAATTTSAGAPPPLARTARVLSAAPAHATVAAAPSGEGGKAAGPLSRSGGTSTRDGNRYGALGDSKMLRTWVRSNLSARGGAAKAGGGGVSVEPPNSDGDSVEARSGGDGNAIEVSRQGAALAGTLASVLYLLSRVVRRRGGGGGGIFADGADAADADAPTPPSLPQHSVDAANAAPPVSQGSSAAGSHGEPSLDRSHCGPDDLTWAHDALEALTPWMAALSPLQLCGLLRTTVWLGAAPKLLLPCPPTTTMPTTTAPQQQQHEPPLPSMALRQAPQQGWRAPADSAGAAVALAERPRIQPTTAVVAAEPPPAVVATSPFLQAYLTALARVISEHPTAGTATIGNVVEAAVGIAASGAAAAARHSALPPPARDLYGKLLFRANAIMAYQSSQRNGFLPPYTLNLVPAVAQAVRDGGSFVVLPAKLLCETLRLGQRLLPGWHADGLAQVAAAMDTLSWVVPPEGWVDSLYSALATRLHAGPTDTSSAAPRPTPAEERGQGNHHEAAAEAAAGAVEPGTGRAVIVGSATGGSQVAPQVPVSSLAATDSSRTAPAAGAVTGPPEAPLERHAAEDESQGEGAAAAAAGGMEAATVGAVATAAFHFPPPQQPDPLSPSSLMALLRAAPHLARVACPAVTPAATSSVLVPSASTRTLTGGGAAAVTATAVADGDGLRTARTQPCGLMPAPLTDCLAGRLGQLLAAAEGNGPSHEDVDMLAAMCRRGQSPPAAAAAPPSGYHGGGCGSDSGATLAAHSLTTALPLVDDAVGGPAGGSPALRLLDLLAAAEPQAAVDAVPPTDEPSAPPPAPPPPPPPPPPPQQQQRRNVVLMPGPSRAASPAVAAASPSASAPAVPARSPSQVKAATAVETGAAAVAASALAEARTRQIILSALEQALMLQLRSHDPAVASRCVAALARDLERALGRPPGEGWRAAADAHLAARCDTALAAARHQREAAALPLPLPPWLLPPQQVCTAALAAVGAANDLLDFRTVSSRAGTALAVVEASSAVEASPSSSGLLAPLPAVPDAVWWQEVSAAALVCVNSLSAPAAHRAPGSQPPMPDAAAALDLLIRYAQHLGRWLGSQARRSDAAEEAAAEPPTDGRPGQQRLDEVMEPQSIEVASPGTEAAAGPSLGSDGPPLPPPQRQSGAARTPPPPPQQQHQENQRRPAKNLESHIHFLVRFCAMLQPLLEPARGEHPDTRSARPSLAGFVAENDDGGGTGDSDNVPGGGGGGHSSGASTASGGTAAAAAASTAEVGVTARQLARLAELLSWSHFQPGRSAALEAWPAAYLSRLESQLPHLSSVDACMVVRALSCQGWRPAPELMDALLDRVVEDGGLALVRRTYGVAALVQLLSWLAFARFLPGDDWMAELMHELGPHLDAVASGASSIRTSTSSGSGGEDATSSNSTSTSRAGISSGAEDSACSNSCSNMTGSSSNDTVLHCTAPGEAHRVAKPTSTLDSCPIGGRAACEGASNQRSATNDSSNNHDSICIDMTTDRTNSSSSSNGICGCSSLQTMRHTVDSRTGDSRGAEPIMGIEGLGSEDAESRVADMNAADPYISSAPLRVFAHPHTGHSETSSSSAGGAPSSGLRLGELCAMGNSLAELRCCLPLPALRRALAAAGAAAVAASAGGVGRGPVGISSLEAPAADLASGAYSSTNSNSSNRSGAGEPMYGVEQRWLAAGRPPAAEAAPPTSNSAPPGRLASQLAALLWRWGAVVSTSTAAAGGTCGADGAAAAAAAAAAFAGQMAAATAALLPHMGAVELVRCAEGMAALQQVARAPGPRLTASSLPPYQHAPAQALAEAGPADLRLWWQALERASTNALLTRPAPSLPQPQPQPQPQPPSQGPRHPHKQPQHHRVLPQLRPYNLVVMLRCMANAGHLPSRAWLQRYCQHTQPLLPSYNAHDLAVSLWAFAHMRLSLGGPDSTPLPIASHPGHLRRTPASAAPQARYGPLGGREQHPGKGRWADAHFVNRAAPGYKGRDPRSSRSSSSSSSSSSYSWVEETAAAQERMAAVPPPRVCAPAALGAWVEAAAALLPPLLRHCGSTDLQNVAWALVTLDFPPAAGWLRQYELATQPRLPYISGAALLYSLWAFAKFGHLPSGAYMESALAALRPGLLVGAAARTSAGGAEGQGGLDASSEGSGGGVGVTDAQSLALLLHSLSQLDYFPGHGWLHEYMQAVLHALPSMGATGLAIMLRAVATLRIHPTPQWLDAVLEAAAAQLPYFTAQQLESFLSAVADLPPAALPQASVALQRFLWVCLERSPGNRKVAAYYRALAPYTPAGSAASARQRRVAEPAEVQAPEAPAVECAGLAALAVEAPEATELVAEEAAPAKGGASGGEAGQPSADETRDAVGPAAVTAATASLLEAAAAAATVALSTPSSSMPAPATKLAATMWLPTTSSPSRLSKSLDLTTARTPRRVTGKGQEAPVATPTTQLRPQEPRVRGPGPAGVGDGHGGVAVDAAAPAPLLGRRVVVQPGIRRVGPWRRSAATGAVHPRTAAPLAPPSGVAAASAAKEVGCVDAAAD